MIKWNLPAGAWVFCWGAFPPNEKLDVEPVCGCGGDIAPEPPKAKPVLALLLLFAPPKTELDADDPKAGGGAAVDPEEPNAGVGVAEVLFPASGLGTAAKLNPPLLPVVPEEPNVLPADCPNAVWEPLADAPKMPAFVEDADGLVTAEPKIFPADCVVELVDITELAAVVALGDATFPNENPPIINKHTT